MKREVEREGGRISVGREMEGRVGCQGEGWVDWEKRGKEGERKKDWKENQPPGRISLNPGLFL